MTTFTTQFSFMDLMKDKGQVPAINEPSIFDELEDSVAEFIEDVTDYTFMDLLKDKGYATRPILAPVYANDNGRLQRIAS